MMAGENLNNLESRVDNGKNNNGLKKSIFSGARQILENFKLNRARKEQDKMIMERFLKKIYEDKKQDKFKEEYDDENERYIYIVPITDDILKCLGHFDVKSGEWVPMEKNDVQGFLSNFRSFKDVITENEGADDEKFYSISAKFGGSNNENQNSVIRVEIEDITEIQKFRKAFKGAIHGDRLSED